jgi:hypothetical protein
MAVSFAQGVKKLSERMLPAHFVTQVYFCGGKIDVAWDNIQHYAGFIAAMDKAVRFRQGFALHKHTQQVAHGYGKLIRPLDTEAC